MQTKGKQEDSFYSLAAVVSSRIHRYFFSLFRIGRSVCSLRFLSFVFSTWRKMKRINYFFEDWLFLKFQFHSFDMDKVL